MVEIESSNTQITETSDRVPAINAVDLSHAFYIHPSDYPDMNLVSTVFDGRSYDGWRRAAIIALSAKNKLGFIDGSLFVPTNITLQKAWSRCNDMVLFWLLNSLSKEIIEFVLYSQIAKVLWSDLEDRFGQANGVKLFQLQKDLNVVVQGNSSISAYFTTMKRVRSNILLSSSLPTIGQAYSLVIQDEKQRKILATPAYPGESTSFLVGNAGEMRFNDYKTQQENFIKKTSLVCNYCKKIGHTIDHAIKFMIFLQISSSLNLRSIKRVLLPGMLLVREKVRTHHGVENDSDVNSLSQENVAQLL
ncbi:uncharacterized protein LOC125854645 [Solanum stenotomum]|uniref:uncharacterized protein LOC125854645 n=1 Tax=Solanum stenotomum TaxID=172797 RepID=UPI0020D06A20|nr:uncharacterized protein LOC125854645 [Solanum stenotomum]